MAICRRKIAPSQDKNTSTADIARTASITWTRRLWIDSLRAYNWGIWTLLTVVLFAQFFAIIWSSVTSDLRFVFGQPPSLGKYFIPGYNDDPYTDRGIVCVTSSRYVAPVQLTQLLKQHYAQTRTTVVNTSYSTNGVDGYRVMTRDSYTIDAQANAYYVRQCGALSAHLESVFSACTALGYNVTRDFLRVVDGTKSDIVVVLPSALPVLIMPYWDYGVMARYIVPGQDGSACMLRVGGTFTSEEASNVAVVYGVPRAVREAKTEQWLDYPGGVWRNGWYEDPVVNMRWYSDVISSVPHGEFGIDLRKFDLLNNAKEADCTKPPYGCQEEKTTWHWDGVMSMTTFSRNYHSIAISNGSRLGLFFVDMVAVQTVTSRYSIERLISNVSLVTLLARWCAVLVALSPKDTIGIAALANTQSFHLLPIFLLPRLKSSLQGFWTAGCHFEGDQRALAEAWFEMYPAIGEVVFMYFSLLNLGAKVLRYRLSDALFGPTLLFCGLLHYFRLELASWHGFSTGGRVSTVVTIQEFEAASILDYFTTDLALRVNGRVRPIFYAKVTVLVANVVLPLLLASRRVPRVDDQSSTNILDVEKALAIHCDSNAGLGSTKSPYLMGAKPALRPYELVRVGYIVVASSSSSGGDDTRVLVSVGHWMWLLATAPLRRMVQLAVRVVVFDVTRAGENVWATPATSTRAARPGETEVAVVEADTPRVVAVSDEEVADVRAWRVSTCPVR